jgi:hypothetical protein
MPKQIQQKTGSASIDKMGHTTTGQFGSSPDNQPVSRKTPRDLNAK